MKKPLAATGPTSILPDAQYTVVLIETITNYGGYGITMTRGANITVLGTVLSDLLANYGSSVSSYMLA